MGETFNRWLGVALSVVVAAAAAEAAEANAATLKLHAPARIGQAKYFRVVASGKFVVPANVSSPSVTVFFTLNSGCPRTFTDAVNAAHTIVIIPQKSVRGSFRVRSRRIHGGAPATGRFCGYLYGPFFQPSQRPKVKAARKIVFF